MAAANFSEDSFLYAKSQGWGSIIRDLAQLLADSLSLPALPLHIHQIVLMTAFYQILYRYILPFLSAKLSPWRYPKLSGVLKLDWDVCAVSLVQSLVNSSLAISLLWTNNPGKDMTWQERIWGYQSMTGSALGIATGYFLWHLGQEIVHRHIEGWIFVFHGAACLVLCALGFRPFALCYCPAFLIMEFPNIFLNIQKFLDKNGLRQSTLRTYNRYALLTTYLFGRLIPGIYFQALMSRDIFNALQQKDPKIPGTYLLQLTEPAHLESTDLYSVPPLPAWLAIIQLLSISLLNLQGLYWFGKLLRSPHYTPVPSDPVPGKEATETLRHTQPGLVNEIQSSSTSKKTSKDSDMPIAIIGMGCRFAGDATGPDKLWEMISTGSDAWSEIPASRFNQNAFFHPNGAREGSTNVRGAHFLKEDISLFDAPFFNITLEEAKAMDPQLRLQLECTYEALENAGLKLDSIANSDTSVYSGIFARDYHESLFRDIETLPRYFNTGNGAAMFSNRISYFFDLKGPSMTVDTGCSTSIVALHLACQSLKSGESKMSIIGGNNLMLNPDMITAMSSFGFVSPDGRSYAFDHRASGYGRGEGVASIIIKPLENALKDGDNIRAVLVQTSLNQDGKTNGITLPSQSAQENLIKYCYNAAGLDPAETPYVEAHGTGTQAGDPLEAGAIVSTFGNGRPAHKPIYIGSVKTNIGHLEAGSGLAGIVKATLVLEKGLIPPSVNFEKGNSKISFSQWKLKMPQTLEQWPVGSPRRISVNSFGYGGTNGHVIMESLEQFLHRAPKLSANSTSATPRAGEIQSLIPTRRRLFTFSAKDQDATNGLVASLALYLKGQKHSGGNELLDNLAYTLSERRTVFPWSMSTTGASVEELINSLEDSKLKAVRRRENVRLGFVFTGQGSQWYAMGRELIKAYPVFKETLMAADVHMRKIGANWSIMDELTKDAKSSLVNEAVYSQPLCTALQVSLVNLLRSWDITPTSVTSHSSGEVAAAYAAGALNLESAITVSYFRGLVTKNIQINSPGLKGSMIAVGLSREDADSYIQRVTSGKIVVGCVNSPTSVTVSGDIGGIDEMQKLLEADGTFVRRLPVDAGYHSHHMEVIADDYRKLLQKHHLNTERWSGKVAYSSSVTGSFVTDSDVFGPEYWIQNMTRPVLFTDSLRNMVLGQPRSSAGAPDSTIDAILEIGPHSGLAAPIKQIFRLPELKDLTIPYVSCLIRKENAEKTMQEMACTLLGIGYRVNVSRLNFPGRKPELKVLADLPSYPWSHKIRHWHESHLNRRHRLREGAPHDLLGVPATNSNPLSPTWRHIIRTSDIPWVRDHLIQGSIIYPAAGYVCMAIEGFCQAFAKDSQDISKYRLRDIEVLNAVLIPETTEGIELQLSLRPAADKLPSAQGWYQFHVHSVAPDHDDKWTEHCTGFISSEFRSRTDDSNWTTGLNLTETSSNIHQAAATMVFKSYDTSKVYEMLKSDGIFHGKAFQNLEHIEVAPNKSLATILIPDTASGMPYGFEHEHVIHPTTFDTILQAIYPILQMESAEAKNPTRLPRSFKSISISTAICSKPGNRLKATSVVDKISAKSVVSSISVTHDCDDTSSPVMEITGFRCETIGDAGKENDNSEQTKLCFQMDWELDVELNGAETYENLDRNSQLGEFLRRYAHKYPGSRCLGFDTTNFVLSAAIIDILGKASTENRPLPHFDIAYDQLDAEVSAAEMFKDHKTSVRTMQFDTLRDPVEQDLELDTYDLVFMSRTSEPTETPKLSFPNIRKLLKSNGRLIMTRVNGCSSKDEESLSKFLVKEGFTIDAVASGFATAVKTEPQSSSEEASAKLPISLIYGETYPPGLWREAFESSLASTLNTPPEIASFDGRNYTGKIIVVLAELIKPLLATLTAEEFLTLKSALMSAKAVLWVTNGGAISCEAPEYSLVTGLFRVLRAENSGTKYITLDLDPLQDCFTSVTSASIISILKAAINSAALTIVVDWEYAQRDGRILIPRLVEDTNTNKIFLSQEDSLVPQMEPFYQADRPLMMKIGTPGLLDTLGFVDDATIVTPVLEDVVEIEPRAFGLNFRDIMVSMGHLDETVMGYECSGVITRTGKAVPQEYRIGDRVCVMMKGNYANLIRVPWETVGKIPEDMPFDVAASLPMVFCTAYYCLYNTARLQKGETILIHAAAGGVGQAAIMLARLLGAEIFVTVGTKEKRDFLIETYGINPDRIFSSRTTAFARQIMAATGQKGVDVILNCLAGEILQETWNCISMLGRFVEIGKRDIELNNHLEMAPFTRNVTFSSIDLTYVMKYKPSILSTILGDCMELFKSGLIHSVKPITKFSMSEIERAFRLMQSGKHRGKVVIEPCKEDTVKVYPHHSTARFEDNASYLIIGGLGGIGRSISRWMVSQGVKNLILLSRSGLTRRAARDFADELMGAGCNVSVFSCDIADENQLSKILRKCAVSMPPIRGVIQAAMALKAQALDPKVKGTWNLHKHFLDGIDFFIMLSSAAGVGGNPGQANYAAGSTFLDAVARHRASKRMPGVTLDLGVIGDVGYVAENEELATRLNKLGHVFLKEKQLLSMIESAIIDPIRDPKSSQIVSGLGQENEGTPWSTDAKFSIFRQMASAGEAAYNKENQESGLPAQLAKVETLQDAAGVICKAIAGKLSQDFMIAEADINFEESLASYGVDSLVAVELRNWVSRQLKADISIFDVLQSKSLRTLAEKIALQSEFVKLG
ncbi:hypothetical protein BP6252_00193 [Coleophoma cylindrospora]|uniref:Carrier domain-containing protein n=1 Tax=Coleophoma cylindrospora TaxID=1849047 RepID=A0A3D8SPQ8_9HELO|nr:hypothetical protein BP6252_00193 [Coleophoma cylindrospora]